MGRIYDNWERLVEAVMHRELFRELSLCDSLSSSPCTSFRSSSFSQSSNTFSPLHPDAQTLNQGNKILSRKLPEKTRNPMWKGLSIFKSFSLKKGYGRGQRELEWAGTHKTLHGLPPIPPVATEEAARKTAEMERLQKLHTFKGHIEAVLRTKGIDLDSIPGHYTV